MSQENAAAKARHYLSEGRLTVRQVDRSGVVAVVCGHSGLVYRVESSPDLGGWLCNCPAHIDQCAHLTALRLGHGRQPEENRVTNERCPTARNQSPSAANSARTAAAPGAERSTPTGASVAAAGHARRPKAGEGASDPARRIKIDCRPVVLSLPGPFSPGTVPPGLLIYKVQDQRFTKIKEARHGTPL